VNAFLWTLSLDHPKVKDAPLGQVLVLLTLTHSEKEKMSFLWKKPKPYDPDKVKTRPPDGMLKKGGEVDKPMTFGYTKYGPVHIVDGKFYAVAVTQMASSCMERKV
jgi:hypothetical protein